MSRRTRSTASAIGADQGSRCRMARPVNEPLLLRVRFERESFLLPGDRVQHPAHGVFKDRSVTQPGQVSVGGVQVQICPTGVATVPQGVQWAGELLVDGQGGVHGRELSFAVEPFADSIGQGGGLILGLDLSNPHGPVRRWVGRGT